MSRKKYAKPDRLVWEREQRRAALEQLLLESDDPLDDSELYQEDEYCPVCAGDNGNGPKLRVRTFDLEAPEDRVLVDCRRCRGWGRGGNIGLALVDFASLEDREEQYASAIDQLDAEGAEGLTKPAQPGEVFSDSTYRTMYNSEGGKQVKDSSQFRARCPRCGGSLVLQRNTASADTDSFDMVYCSNCGIFGSGSTLRIATDVYLDNLKKDQELRSKIDGPPASIVVRGRTYERVKERALRRDARPEPVQPTVTVAPPRPTPAAKEPSISTVAPVTLDLED